MVICFAVDCSHKTVKNSCQFFRFPKIKKQHDLWTELSRRADRKLGKDARLCSCHFKDGKKENGPSIFNRNKSKIMSFPDPDGSKQLKKQDVIEKNVASTTNINQATFNLDQNGASTSKTIQDLKTENLIMQAMIDSLQKQVNDNASKDTLYFGFEKISHSNDLVLLYTGLPNSEMFNIIVNYCKRFEIEYYYKFNVISIKYEDQIFITLQKLRRDYVFEDIAVRYSVSDKCIRNIFFTFLDVLYEIIFKFIICKVENVPSLAHIQSVSCAPDSFLNCRFLVDCTEVQIENPRHSMHSQQQTYSNYKKRQTVKALIAVSPTGIICFISDLFPGSISDKEIVERSGILKILKPGDLIIADKGFKIQDALPDGVFLNVPPFLYYPQFTQEECWYTTAVARARIHVERSIQRIKSFHILDCIPHSFCHLSSKLFQVCGALVSFQSPLIKDDEMEELLANYIL